MNNCRNSWVNSENCNYKLIKFFDRIAIELKVKKKQTVISLIHPSIQFFGMGIDKNKLGPKTTVITCL